jgi:hypothetical protein
MLRAGEVPAGYIALPLPRPGRSSRSKQRQLTPSNCNQEGRSEHGQETNAGRQTCSQVRLGTVEEVRRQVWRRARLLMSERAAFLIVTISRDSEIDIFGGYPTRANAEAVYEKLDGLISATAFALKLIEVPLLDAVVQQTEPVAAPVAPAAAASPVPPEKPAAFRRRSQQEFELETIAMMNGEIPMDGIQFRDADDPIRGGEAFS